MRLRSASLLDLSRIEQIHRASAARFSAAPPPVRLWALVSQTLTALLPLSQETLLQVAEERGRVIGFVQAAGRSPAISLPARINTLQVLNLCVAQGAGEEHVAPALVEHLCEVAAQRGVHRLFVRIPNDDPLLPLFRAHGFRRYATESVLYAESPQPDGDGSVAGLRGARGRDSRSLYHLYRAVTPHEVARLEAPTYRDWRALRSLTGQQEVVDREETVGWCGIQRSSQGRPHTLGFLARPEPELAAGLADHAIRACAEEPAWSSLRHYDSTMIDALSGRAFSLLLAQALLVREVTVTAPAVEQAKGLVPSFS